MKPYLPDVFKYPICKVLWAFLTGPLFRAPGYPAFAATGSSDRQVSVWDLHCSAPLSPLASFKRLGVHCVTWLRHSSSPALLLASFDDSYHQSRTSSAVLEIGSETTAAYPVLAANSAVWQHATCPWTRAAVCVTAAGEALLWVAPGPTKQLEYDKDSSRRRVHLFRTYKVKKEEEAEEEKVATTIRFVDSPLHDLDSAPESEQKLARSQDSMAMEDLAEEEGSGQAMTRVALHPGPASLGLAFVGGRAGLGRVLHVSSLVDDRIKKKLKQSKALNY